jgi:hypothetical protein
MENEAGPRYSKPFYYNYITKGYVDQNYTPTKLPNTNLLHGDTIGVTFQPNVESNAEDEVESIQQPLQDNHFKAEKYKGTQLQWQA